MAFEQSHLDRGKEFLSVVISADPMQELLETLSSARSGLDAMDRPYEVICVTDGRDSRLLESLKGIANDWPELLVLGLRPWTGDDAGLIVAVKRARGPLVMTMAGWPETDPAELVRLTEKLGEADMVSAVRSGIAQGGWQAWRKRRFTGLLGKLFGKSPADPFCRTRLARKPVLEDVAGFGVRQHFIPVIAGQRGYKLAEVELSSAPRSDQSKGLYVFRPLGHLIAFLDAITLFVVLNFLRRPLRFFGSIGLPIFLIGVLTTLLLVVQKFMGDSLADRPALIFAVLMVVLGVQIVAIGLVGEIIIFANSRRMKQYAVREVITHSDLSGETLPDSQRVVAPETVVE